MSTRKTPREEWFSLVEDVGSDPITEEQAILSTGRKFLPPCAIVVLDGGEPSDEYWLWLHTQTSKAQEERVRDGEATLAAAVKALRDTYVAPGSLEYRAGVSQWPVLDRMLQDADKALKGER